jgi:2-methylaconitate cis-trans-isomerase PrpF
MSDPATDGIRCLWMRGGTSKGAYFLADDLPDDPAGTLRTARKLFDGTVFPR